MSRVRSQAVTKQVAPTKGQLKQTISQLESKRDHHEIVSKTLGDTLKNSKELKSDETLRIIKQLTENVDLAYQNKIELQHLKKTTSLFANNDVKNTQAERAQQSALTSIAALFQTDSKAELGLISLIALSNRDKDKVTKPLKYCIEKFPFDVLTTTNAKRKCLMNLANVLIQSSPSFYPELPHLDSADIPKLSAREIFYLFEDVTANLQKLSTSDSTYSVLKEPFKDFYQQAQAIRDPSGYFAQAKQVTSNSHSSIVNTSNNSSGNITLKGQIDHEENEDQTVASPRSVSGVMNDVTKDEDDEDILRMLNNSFSNKR